MRCRKSGKRSVAIRAVLDTNIWVSAILNPSGFPAEILRSFRNGDFLAVISEPIISEIADVLSRPRIKNKYGIIEADILELLILIEDAANTCCFPETSGLAAIRKTTALLKQRSRVMQLISSPATMT